MNPRLCFAQIKSREKVTTRKLNLIIQLDSCKLLQLCNYEVMLVLTAKSKVFSSFAIQVDINNTFSCFHIVLHLIAFTRDAGNEPVPVTSQKIRSHTCWHLQPDKVNIWQCGRKAGLGICPSSRWCRLKPGWKKFTENAMKQELHEIHHRFRIIQCETGSSPVGGQECLVFYNISPQTFSHIATMFCTCPLKWAQDELGVDVAFYGRSATYFQLILTHCILL